MPVTDQATLTPLDTPGQRIRFMRRSRELTQADLARLIFTTQPTVARWERDEFLPGKQSMVLLAQALGVSRLFLFGEEAP